MIPYFFCLGDNQKDWQHQSLQWGTTHHYTENKHMYTSPSSQRVFLESFSAKVTFFVRTRDLFQIAQGGKLEFNIKSKRQHIVLIFTTFALCNSWTYNLYKMNETSFWLGYKCKHCFCKVSEFSEMCIRRLTEIFHSEVCIIDKIR